MARFVGPHDQLDFRELSPDRFQLLAPLWYESDVLGGRVVKLMTGFVFDRESIPRWLPLIYAWLAGTASRAGAVHDWLTQNHKVEDLPVERAMADAVYFEAAQVDGNGWLKRWAKWIGVRLGGIRSWTTGPSRFQLVGNDRRRKPRMAPEERREVLGKLKRIRPPEGGTS